MATTPWETWAAEHRAELDLWKTLNEQARNDITRYKQQQWQVAYYGTLLYGGLIAVSRLLPSLAWMLTGVALMLGVAACAVEWDLHRATERSRKKGEEAVRRFAPEVRVMEEAVRATKWPPNWLVPFLLGAELAVGALITGTLLSWTSAAWWICAAGSKLADALWSIWSLGSKLA